MSKFARVDAQPVRAPRTGLALLVAAPPITSPDQRWIGGRFEWEPEGATGGQTSGLVCGANTGREADASPGIRGTTPWLVWAGETCSTKGWRTRDWVGRARRALEAQQSHLIAAEFWDGAIDDTNGHLASERAETLTTEPVALSVALTFVDAALTRRLRNRTGMVHMRPELVPIAVAGDLIRFDAGAWYTPLGHLVVADSGYSGDGPRPDTGDPRVAADAESQWVVGTDLVAVRLGDVEVLPGAVDDGTGVDRSVNNVFVWAQRPAAVQWDHHAHVAAEVAQGALT